MNNKYLLAFLFLFSVSMSSAQDLMLSELISVEVELKRTGGQLNISSGEIKHSYNNFALLNISEIALQEADILLQYQINHQAPDVYYSISLVLEAPDGSLTYADYTSLTKSNREEKIQSLRWLDILEGKMDLERKYTLLIHVDAYGRLCETMPEKSLAKDLPYMGAAVLGVGAIGIGQIFKQQSNKAEDEYLQIWKDGGTATLEDARQDFKTFQNLTYAGIGILALDGILYYFKQRKLKKDKFRYQTFCAGNKKEINIHPVYRPGSDLGFKLKLNF